MFTRLTNYIYQRSSKEGKKLGRSGTIFLSETVRWRRCSRQADEFQFRRQQETPDVIFQERNSETEARSGAKIIARINGEFIPLVAVQASFGKFCSTPGCILFLFPPA